MGSCILRQNGCMHKQFHMHEIIISRNTITYCRRPEKYFIFIFLTKKVNIRLQSSHCQGLKKKDFKVTKKYEFLCLIKRGKNVWSKFFDKLRSTWNHAKHCLDGTLVWLELHSTSQQLQLHHISEIKDQQVILPNYKKHLNVWWISSGTLNFASDHIWGHNIFRHEHWHQHSGF